MYVLHVFKTAKYIMMKHNYICIRIFFIINSILLFLLLLGKNKYHFRKATCTHTKKYTQKQKQGEQQSVWPAYRRVVLPVHLDGLVRLGGDEPALRVVEHAGEDPGLAVQGARLHGRVDALEVVARPPVPHVDGPVVRCGPRGGKKNKKRDWVRNFKTESLVLWSPFLRHQPIITMWANFGGRNAILYSSSLNFN